MKSALLILNPVEIHDTEKINVINRCKTALVRVTRGTWLLSREKPQFAGSFFPVDHIGNNWII